MPPERLCARLAIEQIPLLGEPLPRGVVCARREAGARERQRAEQRKKH